MKAIDPCPRWMLRDPEEIIEGLLAISARAIGTPVPQPAPATPKDRYSDIARRYRLREALKRVRQGSR